MESEQVCHPVNTDPQGKGPRKEHTSRTTRIPTARTKCQATTSHRWVSVPIHVPNLTKCCRCLFTIYFSSISPSENDIPTQASHTRSHCIFSHPEHSCLLPRLSSPASYILSKPVNLFSPPMILQALGSHQSSLPAAASDAMFSLHSQSQRLHRAKQPFSLRVSLRTSSAPQSPYRPLPCQMARPCLPGSKTSSAGQKSSSAP